MSLNTRTGLAEALGALAVVESGVELVALLAQAHVQSSGGSAVGDLWRAVAKDYCQILCGEDGSSEEGARQSWRSASGRAFERFVSVTVNHALREEGIALVGRGALLAKASNVVDFLTLPTKRICTQDSVGVWPDNDLVALCRRGDGVLQAIAVLSCKTSLRERIMQALFWSLAIKVGIPVKSAFVTLDADNELATCEHPSKARRLVEAYFDGTYVLNESTGTCQAVRPFDDLPRDLVRWRDDLAPGSLHEPLRL